MSAKILFVDDDANVLEAYMRQLRKRFEVATALGGEEGLTILAESGPFDVVVADMQMPNMDGVEFLKWALNVAPDTVRIMLTGNADQQTAIDAVNAGHIFRFLTKPCLPETMLKALEAAVEQRRLIMAEAELLNKTLMGSVGVFTEILAMADPVTFGRTKKMSGYARDIAKSISYRNLWELELATLLSRIGHITIPDDVVARYNAGVVLNAQETAVLARVPEIGYHLLKKIPRLETVAAIILYQERRFDGSDHPKDGIVSVKIPRGSRILKILSDLMDMEAQGTQRSIALRLLRTRNGWYDPDLLDAVTVYFNPPLAMMIPEDGPEPARPRAKNIKAEDIQAKEAEQSMIEIAFEELTVGDTIAADICAPDGSLLLSARTAITEPILHRLQNYAALKGVTEPIMIRDDSEEPEKAQAA